MSYSVREMDQLESQLAQLRRAFEDATTPILARLAEMRSGPDTSDRQLLIPRQARRHSPGVRLPRSF